MVATIFHRLEYIYDMDVFLGPQQFYLSIKPDAHIDVIREEIAVYPPPEKLIEQTDAEGNVLKMAFFEKKTKQLLVESKIKLEAKTFNPFDFYYFPKESQRLPVKYPEEHSQFLQAYLLNEQPTDEIRRISDYLKKNSAGFTSAFLMAINHFIFEGFAYEIRHEGNAKTAIETLNRKSGSCRDFAYLFAAIAQAQGLATRFVSGYYLGHSPIDAPDQSHNLHAWVEVFLPGGGWRGFDPTQNEVVCGNHVALACSYDLSKVAPVSGYFFGNAVSTLKTIVDLKMVNN